MRARIAPHSCCVTILVAPKAARPAAREGDSPSRAESASVMNTCSATLLEFWTRERGAPAETRRAHLLLSSLLMRAKRWW